MSWRWVQLAETRLARVKDACDVSLTCGPAQTG